MENLTIVSSAAYSEHDMCKTMLLIPGNSPQNILQESTVDLHHNIANSTFPGSTQNGAETLSLEQFSAHRNEEQLEKDQKIGENYRDKINVSASTLQVKVEMEDIRNESKV